MTALTSHDHWLQSPIADDPATSSDPDSIIDEMVAEPDCFDAWLDCPPSVAGLLSLILDRGLPCGTDERSDELRDMYETRAKSVRDDFVRWAHEPTRFRSAPIDTWREMS
jgi:hypothetical protein